MDFKNITKLINYIKKNGFKSAYQLIKIKLNLNTTTNRTRVPSVVCFSHQLDNSGAPFVFISFVEELRLTHPHLPIEFHTFAPVANDNVHPLVKASITPIIHQHREISLNFINGDVVVLNTVAYSATLRNCIYTALEKNIVKKLIWFIHEDEPELIFQDKEYKRIMNLLHQNKIIMFSAAERTVNNYRNFFNNNTNIRTQRYKYIIPEKFHKIRTESDFDKISFILPGTMYDGRKGQIPVFHALYNFMERFYNKNPQNYRDFELVFIGVINDFISQQLLKHAPKMLGNRFKHYGYISHEECSELILRSNVTLCYSVRECLPLSVFEGMAAGHPILRNDSSGMKEQLDENQNGFYLDSHDFNQVVETFEKILNRTTTSNKTLANMSAYSNKIAREQAKFSYAPMIETTTKAFAKSSDSYVEPAVTTVQ